MSAQSDGLGRAHFAAVLGSSGGEGINLRANWGARPESGEIEAIRTRIRGCSRGFRPCHTALRVHISGALDRECTNNA